HSGKIHITAKAEFLESMTILSPFMRNSWRFIYEIQDLMVFLPRHYKLLPVEGIVVWTIDKQPVYVEA
ncbi:MAG TPA: hypothetical protein VKR06_17535, partial [Ktedonosporobacter sp.]|nr:hypothetical protein [Ktedonosporobacter sp.]